MVIACDTSFLFSLYGTDSHSPKAVAWAAQQSTAIHLNSLTHFEFGNAVRFAQCRNLISLEAATQYWSGFETAISQGRIIHVISNFADVVEEASRISAQRTLSGGHRGFDILHVASALTMKATHFLTFDENQKRLAEAEGLIVPTALAK